MSYYVYAIFSPSLGQLYVGQTNDISKRIFHHNKGYSRYTKRASDWELIYTEECLTRSDSILREKQLKSYRGREHLRNFIKT